MDVCEECSLEVNEMSMFRGRHIAKERVVSVIDPKVSGYQQFLLGMVNQQVHSIKSHR